MSRGGVTYSEVEAAAFFLQSTGKAPTLDNIRAQIGTGSRTTLAAHLKTWKEKQEDYTGRLPQHLAALVNQLWEEIQTGAQQRIDASETEWHEKVAALQTELLAMRQARVAAETTLTQSRNELADANRTSAVLNEELRMMKETYSQLQAQQQTAASQLEDARTEINRLHQLANQMQRNLEHYQNAIQQQKMAESLRQEKHEAAFSRELTNMASMLDTTKSCLIEKEQQLAESRQITAQLQAEHISLTERHTLLNKQHREIEHNSIRLQTQLDIQQRQQTVLQQKLADEQQQRNMFEKELAAAGSAQTYLQLALSKAEDKIASFQQHNTFLHEENMQLKSTLSKVLNKKITERADTDAI